MSYSSVQNAGNVALDAVTPVKVLSANAARHGYRVTNNSSQLVYLREVPAGDAAPDLTAMVTNLLSQQLPSGSYLRGDGKNVDVYAIADANTPNVFVEELV